MTLPPVPNDFMSGRTPADKAELVAMEIILSYSFTRNHEPFMATTQQMSAVARGATLSKATVRDDWLSGEHL